MFHHSPRVKHVYVLPGNGGTYLKAKITSMDCIKNTVKDIAGWANNMGIYLIVLGSGIKVIQEDGKYDTGGLGDYFRESE